MNELQNYLREINKLAFFSVGTPEESRNLDRSINTCLQSHPMARDEVERTRREGIERGELVRIITKAIEKEVAETANKISAESLLGSPDATVQNRAKEQISEAEAAIKAAKEEQLRAIENGADSQFHGFSSDEPGFDVPSSPSALKKSGT